MTSRSKVTKFVSDLPYGPRTELCKILDFKNDWKTLAGSHLNYNVYDIFRMGLAIQRSGSPTDELLSCWGSRNHTTAELFRHLGNMKHFKAMLILKPYVDPRYHHYMVEASGGQTVSNNTRSSPSDSSVKLTEESISSQRAEASARNENQVFNEQTRKVSDPLVPFGSGIPHISYQELSAATANWHKDNVLGRGGFGIVFKGLWKHTEIAVKKLESFKSGRVEETNQCQREQTERELKYLNSCRHDNILPLYGVCFEPVKYCLVYQFMPNGSLEDRLQMRKKASPALTWSERERIAKGAARGLQFLHRHEIPLIHGDIKSANILLNSHMEPVIGDFGLTQEGPIEKATHITLKRINGTRAYLPHDFFINKQLSTKIDVYCFGIVLFELATGFRALDENRKTGRLLKDFVDKYPEESLLDLFDKNAQPIERDKAERFLRIGKKSTVTNPRERPEMMEVYSMLNETSREEYDMIGGNNMNRAGNIPVTAKMTSQHRAVSPVINSQPNKFIRTSDSKSPMGIPVGPGVHVTPDGLLAGSGIYNPPKYVQNVPSNQFLGNGRPTSSVLVGGPAGAHMAPTKQNPSHVNLNNPLARIVKSDSNGHGLQQTTNPFHLHQQPNQMYLGQQQTIPAQQSLSKELQFSQIKENDTASNDTNDTESTSVDDDTSSMSTTQSEESSIKDDALIEDTHIPGVHVLPPTVEIVSEDAIPHIGFLNLHRP